MNTLIISEIKSLAALECFVEPGKSSQKKLALLCLMQLWFYRYSITVALCGMVAVRETRTTLTFFPWPSLQCRREYQKCIQVCKCIKGLAPAYLLDDFHSSEQIHTYNTRNKDLIRLPLAKTTKF